MSSNKRRARMTLAKKIERELEIQAEQDRKRIREEALERDNGK